MEREPLPPKPKKERPVLPWDKAIALLLLMACSAPPAPRSDAGAQDASFPAPPSYDDGYGPPDAEADLPCVRQEVVRVGRTRLAVELPCRPYDRLRDLPDPPP